MRSVRSGLEPFQQVAATRPAALPWRLREYHHRPTGARHLHVECDDPRRVFLLALQTPAPDDSGITHVLEHMLLSGSRRYPVDDLFFAMASRTLATDMNAFTTSRLSAYHFTTRHTGDYTNLARVYFDAVFSPTLTPRVFHREAVRVDPGGPEPSYQGAVYNEMRGLCAAPEFRLGQAVQAALLPDSPYQFNAGGEPSRLCRLSLQRVRRYYRRHVQPGNVVLLSYGAVPVAELQGDFYAAISQRNPRRAPAPASVGRPAGLGTAVDADLRYPVSDPSQAPVLGAVAWRFDRGDDPLTACTARWLAQVLLAGEQGLLRRAVLAQPEVSGVGASTGLIELEDALVLRLVLYLEPGVDASSLRGTVNLALNAVRREGIAEATRAAGLAGLALDALAPQPSHGTPGLALLQRLLPAVTGHYHAPSLLDWHEPVQRLAARLDRPGVGESLIATHLLDNPAQASVTLQPAPADAEPDRPVMGTRARTRWQAVAAELACPPEATPTQTLPRLVVRNLSLAGSAPRCEVEPLGGLTVCWYPVPDDGVVWARLAARLDGAGAGALAGGPLWRDCLNRMPPAGTGGTPLEASLSAYGDGVDRSAAHAVLHLAGRSLGEEAPALIRRLWQVLTWSRGDDRGGVSRWLRDEIWRRTGGVMRAGHEHAMRAAAAGVCAAGGLNHRFDGLGYLAWLKSQVETPASGKAELAAQLAHQIQTPACAPLALMVVCDPARWTALRRVIEQERVPAGGTPVAPLRLEPAPARQAWAVPGAVNYCAGVYAIGSPAGAAPAAPWVLAALLESGYLQCAVRQRGGAYATGARVDPLAGCLSLFSYRDPRCRETLADFTVVQEALAVLLTDPDRLEDARLGALRRLERLAVTPWRHALEDFHWRLGRGEGLPAELAARVRDVGASTLAEVLNSPERPSAQAVLAGEASAEALRRAGWVVGTL